MTSRAFEIEQTDSHYGGRSSLVETDSLQFLARSRLHLSTVHQEFQRAKGCLDDVAPTSELDRARLYRQMEEIVDNYVLNLSYVLKVLMQIDISNPEGVYALSTYMQHGAWDSWAGQLQEFVSTFQHLPQSVNTSIQVPFKALGRMADTCLYLSAVADGFKNSLEMKPTVDYMKGSVASCLRSEAI